MSGLLSLSGTKAANDLKVNVVNTSNINLHETRSVKKSSETEPLRGFKEEPQKLRDESEFTKEVYASYPDGEGGFKEENPYANLSSDDITKLKNENEALKIIIGIIQNNPFYLNKFIIADDVKLMELVKLLCNVDDVQMDAEDIGEGCITRNKYRKVHAIYVIKGGETKNLKYDFPEVVRELTELCVSTKFVY